MRRSYKASGALGDGNVASLIAVAMLVGGLVGAAEGLASKWFSLFLVFPALIGGAAGIAVDRMVASKNMRAPTLAFIAAGLGGLVGQAAMHGASYELFRMQATKQIAEDALTDADAGDAMPAPDVLLDGVLLDKTGHDGFRGYLLMQADTGVEVRNHGSHGINFSGSGFWGLFAFEFLLAAGVAASIGAARAKQPFCENCRRWYDEEEVLAVGGGDKSVVTTLAAAFEREAWGEVASALGTPDEKTFSSISVRRCRQCEQSDPQIFLRRTVNAKKKPQSRQAWSSLVRHDELQTLKNALPSRPQAAAAPAPAPLGHT